MAQDELSARAMGMAMSFAEAVQSGDRGAVTRLSAELADLRRDAADRPQLVATLDVLDQTVAMMQVRERGEDPAHRLRQWRDSVDSLPENHPLRSEVDESSQLLEAYLGRLHNGRKPAAEEVAVEAARARQPGLSPAQQAYHYAMAGGLAFGDGAGLELVTLGIDHVRTAVKLAPADDSRRVAWLVTLAVGLFQRSELTAGLADVDAAEQALTEARMLAGGPQHPYWPIINEMLSHTGRRAQPRPAADHDDRALDGLRGYAWQALIQSDLVTADRAVRNAADSAVDAARRYLTAGDPVRAIRALDAGRGLALFAANRTRGVADQLDRAGRPELARRWRAAGRADTLSTDLRTQVWTALSGTGADDPLDVPDLAQIRTALTRVQADALVYLVPGRDYAPGHAVIAAVDGPPSYLALPELTVEPGQDVERYLTALSRRDLGPADDTDAEFAGRLDDLCDWAWRAAMGPLIETYLPGLPRRRPDQPPRIVLVAMGELAWVPWQAARHADGTYAVERIAVSQTASARMLCHSAQLSPVPVGPVGLVVGDPDTAGHAPALTAARLEAYAVHRTFYRGARYLGRRVGGSDSPSGRGTAAEIHDWLTNTRPGAGAMLHLACHGVLQSGPAATSYLLLAGGSRLAADEVIALLGQVPDRPLALVVLAACRTGRAITGHDEAFSLGTTFLAGGARSVLATQWSIPDAATSVLMFMVHHFLTTRRLPPWAALREAQLWMLRPHRTVPASMPPVLSSRLDETGPAEVVSWAGFVHGGQ